MNQVKKLTAEQASSLSEQLSADGTVIIDGVAVLENGVKVSTTREPDGLVVTINGKTAGYVSINDRDDFIAINLPFVSTVEKVPMDLMAAIAVPKPRVLKISELIGIFTAEEYRKYKVEMSKPLIDDDLEKQRDPELDQLVDLAEGSLGVDMNGEGANRLLVCLARLNIITKARKTAILQG